MFISALFSLRSPVPLRLLPAVFVHCGPRAKDEMTLTAETQPPIFLSISHAITCLHFSPVFKSAFVCLDAFMGRAVRLLSFFSLIFSLVFPPLLNFDSRRVCGVVLFPPASLPLYFCGNVCGVHTFV